MYRSVVLLTQVFAVHVWLIALILLSFLVKSGLLFCYFLKQKASEPQSHEANIDNTRSTPTSKKSLALTTQESLEIKTLEAMNLHDTFRKFVPTQFISNG